MEGNYSTSNDGTDNIWGDGNSTSLQKPYFNELPIHLFGFRKLQQSYSNTCTEAKSPVKKNRFWEREGKGT